MIIDPMKQERIWKARYKLYKKQISKMYNKKYSNIKRNDTTKPQTLN